MTLIAHEAKYELLAAWRNPRARFFTVIFPLILMVIFGSAFHGTTTVDGVSVGLTRFFVPSVLTLSLVTASYATLVISMANARETGILKRRRATPVPASVLVAGKALATLVTAVGMTALLLVLAQAAYGVGFSASALLAIAAAVVIGTLALSCVGYAVSGLIGNADAAQPIVQATLLPLYFISGVWIPTDQLPSGLQHIAALFPIEHLANALHLASVHGSLSGAFAPRDLLVLAAWAAGAAIFAARRFSWLPSTATA
ncbi:MAG TPA: ABC transporter permease [Thermoleophilaceae bacterium]|nr:ABC transporter permease [Thermoleophilaceae bacterium]